jgi:hypothetical protein
MAEKASHHFRKAPIPLKMYLKSLAILEKASISLKKSSKIIEILKFGNVFEKPRYIYKIIILIKEKPSLL